MKRIVSIACLLLLLTHAFPQITGTINTYTAVSSVNAAAGKVQVASAAGFSAGDRVLLIQMKGAVIPGSNSANFGVISNLNGSGAYELGTICEINGNEITFENTFAQNYNPAAVTNPAIQLIRVPQYTNVNVGNLTIPDWDGSTGGVLVLEATGSISLSADIDVTAKGFRGGLVEIMNPGCFFTDDYDDFYYEQSDERAAKKGEGIAAYINNREYGRGAQASGGGGGNDHNAGGGGGSNYGLGGLGGQRHNVGFFDCKGFYPGEGGKALNGFGYSALNNHVFLGGGGGSGHANNINEGTSGGDGGGMVILIGSSIEGNGHSILANGITPPNAGSDAGSGGGAGGTILLDVASYGASMLHLEAQGGNGGGSSFIGIDCHGPGGGGSGGVVWVSNSLTGNVSTNISGGVKGIVDPSVSGCGTGGGGVQPGGNGQVIQSPALDIPQSLISNPQCVLPIEWTYFEAREVSQQIRLDWSANIQGHGVFQIERSADGIEFEALGQTDADAPMQWWDGYPLIGMNYYRLQWIEENGYSRYSQIQAMYLVGFDKPRLWVQSESLSTNTLSIDAYLPDTGPVSLWFIGMNGQRIQLIDKHMQAGWQNIQIPIGALSGGLYVLQLAWNGQLLSVKVPIGQK